MASLVFGLVGYCHFTLSQLDLDGLFGVWRNMEQQGFKCVEKQMVMIIVCFLDLRSPRVVRLIHQICIQVPECGEEKD